MGQEQQLAVPSVWQVCLQDKGRALSVLLLYIDLKPRQNLRECLSHRRATWTLQEIVGPEGSNEEARLSLQTTERIHESSPRQLTCGCHCFKLAKLARVASRDGDFMIFRKREQTCGTRFRLHDDWQSGDMAGKYKRMLH